MPRIALIVAYNGHPYHGWQFQGGNLPTIQRDLMRAVSTVADSEVTLYCAGRTDSGVHATKQVVHFDTNAVRPDKAWVQGVNAHMNNDISVEWAGEVGDDFDARRTATARHYCYCIYNRKVRSGLMSPYLTHEHRQLDVERMHEGAQLLLGENDFSSFRAATCQSPTPWRRLMTASVRRSDDLVIIDIIGNAFLHHMVRNIAGVLMDVGAGEKEPDWVKQLLALRDRSKGSVTAPPNGLYLIDVCYPKASGIPQDRRLPHFLQVAGL